MITISTEARNAAGDAIVDLIDVGSIQPNGYIEIRTGAKPTSPQAVATGTLLAICPMSRPAFNDFAIGESLANPIADDTDIAASGVAGWFRIYNRDGNAVMDGEIGVTGGKEDLLFDTINFISGGTVSITSLVARMGT